MVFHLEATEEITIQLSGNPSPPLEFHVSYEEIDGFSNMQRKTEEKSVLGQIGSASQTIFIAPSDKRIRVVNYSITNTTGSAIDIRMLAGGGQIFRYTSIAPGDVIAPNAILSSDGLQRTSGEPGQNATQVLTSTTGNLIGTGNKTFNYPSTPNIGIAVGTRVRAADFADPSNYMEGDVLSISGTQVVVNVDYTSGTGTLADWSIGIVGRRGSDGANGTVGAAGANGLSADMYKASSSALSIGFGSKVFSYTTSANLGWAVGMRLRAAFDESNFMEGNIVSLSPTSVELNVTDTVGLGSYSFWSIGVAGLRGLTGVAGPAGANGSDGANGSNGANADMVRSSTTSHTVNAGSKTFTFTATSANLGWFVGQYLRASNSISNYVEGMITAVSSSSVTIDVSRAVGSGTHTSWTIGVSGSVGATGATGSTGAAGAAAVLTRTSSTSNSIGTGSKTWTYTSSTNLGWTVGTRLKITNSAANYMEGAITSVSATSVTVNVDYAAGTGTLTSWSLGLGSSQRTIVEIRNSVSMVSNGTTAVNLTAIADFSDYSIYFNSFTGGSTENNLIDIINAREEQFVIISVGRDATAGTKTINFFGTGRTYNRSWLTGAQPIGVNEKWLFFIRSRSATEFDVISQRVA